MGRNSQQRKAHQQRRDAARLRSATTDPEPDLAQLLALATQSAYGPGANKLLFTRVMQHVHRVATELEVAEHAAGMLGGTLQRLVDGALDHGWQPADLVHVAKREWTLRASRMVVACLADHARRHDAPGRAPHAWLAQLHELGVVQPTTGMVVGGRGDVLATWARTEKQHPEEALTVAVQLTAQLGRLPHLSMLVDPPARWGASNRGVQPAAASSGVVDAKTLKVIRALLAKAEATTFEAEAQAFTAKAQELMTRHSIDAAVLASSVEGATGARRGIESRRVHIDNPYADEKATFLSAIASVNGARSIWMPQAGFATLMGFPIDVQLTDLLFTSLLVQATRAAAEATAHDGSLRTASFKRAFLIAFADRVAERLEHARQHVATEAQQHYGNALVPILADREAAVEAAFTESFPNITMMPSRRLNAHGWHAGRAAGDRADIGAGAAITPG